MTDVPREHIHFGGDIPEIYERSLVPLIFEWYAADLATRVAARAPQAVLEIAAGTGVVTRHLVAALPPATSIVATDLNQPMLDKAAAIGTTRPVTWKQADALQLPFEDATFDVVVCQFGTMFFPDRPAAYREARRVLHDGGAFLFNVWDRIEENEIADAVTAAVGAMFPDDPPRFLARTPHGHFETSEIQRDLLDGGFTNRPLVDVIAARSKASSAREAAAAYVRGTPLLNEIEARDAGRVEEALDHATDEVTQRFGEPVDAKIQALVVEVER